MTMDGRAVDALAAGPTKGAGDAAKHLGERLARDDPRVPEWSNPAAVKPRHTGLNT